MAWRFNDFPHRFDVPWYVIVCTQVGTLRFCGSTEFSGGLWAGVELDKPEGKNDGSVAGVQYFTCRMKHGRSGLRQHLKIKHIDSPTCSSVTSTIIEFRRLKWSNQIFSDNVSNPRKLDLSFMSIVSKLNVSKLAYAISLLFIRLIVTPCLESPAIFRFVYH